MNRSSVTLVVLGVLVIVAVAGWYANPGGLLVETLSGSRTPHLFLFPRAAAPLMNTSPQPPAQEEMLDFSIQTTPGSPSATSTTVASSSS